METGWGTSAPATESCNLQEGSMSVLANTSANGMLAPLGISLVASQLAVYDSAHQVTACNADEGSGLFCPLNGKVVLCGVNSFSGGGSCSASYPYVTTRVSSFLDWITANMP
jgi:secreted trypsin-like serine protease